MIVRHLIGGMKEVAMGHQLKLKGVSQQKVVSTRLSQLQAHILLSHLIFPSPTSTFSFLLEEAFDSWEAMQV